jgi:hypothetical protein
MEKEKPKKQLNKYIVFSTMVFQMGITIAIGTYFGQWLDGTFPNNYSLYTIVFSLLSVFGSLYLVIKQLANINKTDQENN